MIFISEIQAASQLARNLTVSGTISIHFVQRSFCLRQKRQKGSGFNGTVMPKSLSRHELEAAYFSELPD